MVAIKSTRRLGVYVVAMGEIAACHVEASIVCIREAGLVCGMGGCSWRCGGRLRGGLGCIFCFFCFFSFRWCTRDCM